MSLEVRKIPRKIGHNYSPLRVLPFDYLQSNAARDHHRLSTFIREGVNCLCCGKKGVHLILAEDRLGNKHIDLYTSDFDMIVSTRIPLGDGKFNKVPMCHSCNEKK